MIKVGDTVKVLDNSQTTGGGRYVQIGDRGVVVFQDSGNLPFLVYFSYKRATGLGCVKKNTPNGIQQLRNCNWFNEDQLSVVKVSKREREKNLAMITTLLL